MAFLALSLTPALIVAVYFVKGVSGFVGEKVAVLPEKPITPAMGVVPSFTVKFAMEMVEASMGSLKTALMEVLKLIPLDASNGLVDTTWGQIPTSPVSSTDFLQPKESTKAKTKYTHLLMKRLVCFGGGNRLPVSEEK
jgi:hypothetical protein